MKRVCKRSILKVRLKWFTTCINPAVNDDILFNRLSPPIFPVISVLCHEVLPDSIIIFKKIFFTIKWLLYDSDIQQIRNRLPIHQTWHSPLYTCKVWGMKLSMTDTIDLQIKCILLRNCHSQHWTNWRTVINQDLWYDCKK